MISTDDIQKLANLAHLAVATEELQKIAGELEAVLGYVSEVTKLSAEEVHDTAKPTLRNVMRPDAVTNEPGEYTDAIVAQFPDRKGKALRVKKIL